MIQDSVNQALNSIGAMTSVYKYLGNQKKQLANEAEANNLKQVKAGTETYKAQAQSIFATEDELKAQEELQANLDPNKPEYETLNKIIEENKKGLKGLTGEMRKSQDELQKQIGAKAGMTPIMKDNQVVGWENGNEDNLPSAAQSTAYKAFAEVAKADAARQNSLMRAKLAAYTKQDQANNNFITIMGQNVRRDDPKYAKIIEQVDKENKK